MISCTLSQLSSSEIVFKLLLLSMSEGILIRILHLHTHNCKGEVLLQWSEIWYCSKASADTFSKCYKQRVFFIISDRRPRSPEVDVGTDRCVRRVVITEAACEKTKYL
jgi:hypothetical protein